MRINTYIAFITHGVLHSKDSWHGVLECCDFNKFQDNLLRAMTKLNSHCVPAPIATVIARSRAVGISLTKIQHAGPQPNWKMLLTELACMTECNLVSIKLTLPRGKCR